MALRGDKRQGRTLYGFGG
nr:osteogenic bone growth factor [synthetic construct]